MKIWKFIQLISLFLVVYTTGVKPVFATTETFSYVQQQESVNRLDPSQKAGLYFEEVSILDINSSEIENKFHGFGARLSNFNWDFSNSNISFRLAGTLSHRDKRKLIAASIFPFHFFW